jgi:translocator assembly and maintenance protein 41
MALRRHFTSNSNDGQPSKHTGQRIDRLELQHLVDRFPPVVHSFGYGSGVFAQRDNENGMVDLILVVDNAQKWHQLNLNQHQSHYSLVPRLCGSNFCAHLQKTGPGVYFHTNIEVEQRVIKYGVVERSQLQEDLQHWSYLYLAGRLHKPTVVIKQDDYLMETQQTRNLPAALAASLLLLSQDDGLQQYSLADVYQQIAQLSYAGDFRTKLGAEDPNKIHKLVHSPGQLQRFDDLYKDSLRDMEQAGLVSVMDGTSIEYRACGEFYHRLPARFAKYANLRAPLARIVSSAARTQSLKGIVTAGFVRSTQYAVAKLSKGMFRSMP